MQNENESNAPSAKPCRDGVGRVSATTGQLWGIIICAAVYGVVNFASGVLVLFLPETIEGTKIYPFAFWNVVAGPLAVGMIFWLWTRWKNIS